MKHSLKPLLLIGMVVAAGLDTTHSLPIAQAIVGLAFIAVVTAYVSDGIRRAWR